MTTNPDITAVLERVEGELKLVETDDLLERENAAEMGERVDLWEAPEITLPAATVRALTQYVRAHLSGGGMEALRLIAEGWTVIESDGRVMTIQAPEDWEGETTELVVDTTFSSSNREEPKASGVSEGWDRDAVAAAWYAVEMPNGSPWADMKASGLFTAQNIVQKAYRRADAFLLALLSDQTPKGEETDASAPVPEGGG